MAGQDGGFSFTLTRAHVEFVNRNKVRQVFDFAYGEFLANKNFFNELSRVQSQIIENNEVELQTGQTADLNTIGGALALSIYTETLDSMKEAMVGLSKLGLKNENKLWTLLGA
jgi:hypothetical protein